MKVMDEDKNIGAWFILGENWEEGDYVPLVPAQLLQEARRVAREWYRRAQEITQHNNKMVKKYVTERSRADALQRQIDEYFNRAEAAEAELQSCLVHVMNVAEERNEARRWSSAWKKKCKWYRTEGWKAFVEQRNRAEAAEQRVQEMERINQQLLEALELVEETWGTPSQVSPLTWNKIKAAIQVGKVSVQNEYILYSKGGE